MSLMKINFNSLPSLIDRYLTIMEHHFNIHNEIDGQHVDRLLSYVYAALKINFE